MSLTAIIITALAIGIIVGGILLLKKSAHKFNLTAEQLANIKKRNEALDKQEHEHDSK
jgi:sensor histidine kinase regulating citrate/malate metabolism